MITILTLAIGHDFCHELKDCLDSKKAYALKHGYNYIQGGADFWLRDRPIPWSKVPFVLDVLASLPEGALVWLSDADVLITNSDLEIETHILPHFPLNKHMLMCIDACGNLNSGNLSSSSTSIAIGKNFLNISVTEDLSARLSVNNSVNFINFLDRYMLYKCQQHYIHIVLIHSINYWRFFYIMIYNK